MSVFFISDTHFCDQEIMRFEPILPYGVHTREKLDDYIIEQWNKTVYPEDIVYHLGDVGRFGELNRAKDIIGSLNGHKRLILGNHDVGWAEEFKEYLDFPGEGFVKARNAWEAVGFEEVYTTRIFFGDFAVLNHKPPEFANEPYFWIFGHVHTQSMYRTITESSACVCADRWGFTPVSYDLLETLRYKIINMYEHQGYNFFMEDVGAGVTSYCDWRKEVH